MFSKKLHNTVTQFGLCALAFGMMMGTVPTSVPLLILFGNWLFEGGFTRKLDMLRGNKIFWAVSAIFLIHVAGLFYTSDLQSGWDDVRTKLPLMFLPVVLFSYRPLTEKETQRIFFFFIAGCIVSSLWCLIYNYVLHPGETLRNTSRFMSHIRYGLYLNVGVFTCLFASVKMPAMKEKVALVIAALYLMAVMIALGLVSALLYLIILSLASLLYITWKSTLPVKITAVAATISMLLAAGYFFLEMKKMQLNESDCKCNTPVKESTTGKSYIHFDSLGQKENGNYVLINIQLEELQREWKLRFSEDSFSYSSQHNIRRYEVLVRYLASRGLNKDSAGIAGLTPRDLKNIRNGITNYRYADWGFLNKRIYHLVNEYDEFVNNRYINGHSIIMRLYFWKAALHAIKQQPLFGAGTGDVQQAMNKAYTETSSPLDERWRLRPHNQFVTVTVALGVFGLIIFLFGLAYPAIALRRDLDNIYWIFFGLLLISFLSEDTLETQAGLTFFAFFNSLLISKAWNNS